MHRLFSRKFDADTLIGVGMLWIAAPSVPYALGLTARLSYAPVSWQKWIVEQASFALIPGLLLLSLWGAARIRAELKARPLEGSMLIGLPVYGLVLAAVAGLVGRKLTADLSEEWGGGFGLYAAFLLVWVALVAQQLKYLWEHVLEAWEKRRSAFFPGVPKFNRWSRWLARRALADRQALAWLQRRRSGWTAEDREAFRTWRRKPGKKAGLRRRQRGTSPLLRIIVGFLIAIVMLGNLLHQLREPRRPAASASSALGKSHGQLPMDPKMR